MKIITKKTSQNSYRMI